MINLNLNPTAVLDLQPEDQILFQDRIFITKALYNGHFYFVSEDSRIAEFDKLVWAAMENYVTRDYPVYKDYITHIRVCLEDQSESDHLTTALTRQGWYRRLLNNECVIG